MTAFLLVPLFVYAGCHDRQNIAWDKLSWATLAAVVSIGMLYRYLKFFRHYTMEVFQTYAETPLATVPEAKSE